MGTVETPQTTGDLATEAYFQIKEAIRGGSFRSGDRMVEKELTERLNMSRTPVREALQRLKTEGLLTYEPRRGLTVMRPDHQMVMELYAMREVLEAKAASLAAQHASDIELATLSELIKEEENYFDNPKRMSEINQHFHAMMYLAAHNRYLLRSLQTMSDTMSLLPTMLGDPQRAKQAHQEHLQIIDGIIARNPEASAKAMETHIRSAQLRRIRWLVESGTLSA